MVSASVHDYFICALLTCFINNIKFVSVFFETFKNQIFFLFNSSLPKSMILEVINCLINTLYYFPILYIIDKCIIIN